MSLLSFTDFLLLFESLLQRPLPLVRRGRETRFEEKRTLTARGSFRSEALVEMPKEVSMKETKKRAQRSSYTCGTDDIKP